MTTPIEFRPDMMTSTHISIHNQMNTVVHKQIRYLLSSVEIPLAISNLMASNVEGRAPASSA